MYSSDSESSHSTPINISLASLDSETALLPACSTSRPVELDVQMPTESPIPVAEVPSNILGWSHRLLRSSGTEGNTTSFRFCTSPYFRAFEEPPCQDKILLCGGESG